MFLALSFPLDNELPWEQGLHFACLCVLKFCGMHITIDVYSVFVEWCLGEWMDQASQVPREPQKMALIRAWKGTTGMKPREKMASETHDNIIWHLGTALVFLSWVFIRNGVLSASVWPCREGGDAQRSPLCVWGEVSQIPSRSKVLKND